MKFKNTKLGSEYKSGDVIIKQGTTGNCLYVIQQYLHSSGLLHTARALRKRHGGGQASSPAGQR